jgi:predicted metal-dependent enzyme (double-stranded beta helix superfamily)
MNALTEGATKERESVPASLKRFIWDIQSIIELAESEREILVIGRDLMARLVASDDWLPAVFAAPGAIGGVQFQLYSDAFERFSVVATVLSDGQGLLIDQPLLWEIVGVLRGGVFLRTHDASANPPAAPTDQGRVLRAGDVNTRGSRTTEAVALSNALPDQISICIHVYGGDLSRLSRRILTANACGEGLPFGYANDESAPSYDILSIQTKILD